jgi:hypothetical protein
MRRTQRKIDGLFAAAAVVTALSALSRPALACDACESKFKPGTYTGEAQRVGNGVAYSWVTLNEKGKPSAVGVTLTETALEGLPQTPPTGMVGHEFMLMLPEQAAKTPIDHIGLGWNPQGHEPPGIYDTPHFDVHFYMIPLGARQKITATGADVATCRKPVPARFAPAGYVYAKGTEVPMMGGHWVDPKAPELNGQPFTKTFLYGSYDGRMIFLEPMLTKAYLETKPDFSEAIKLPASYAKSAFYPTRYSIRHDPIRREYTIAIEGMTWRDAAEKGPTSNASRAPPRHRYPNDGARLGVSLPARARAFRPSCVRRVIASNSSPDAMPRSARSAAPISPASNGSRMQCTSSPAPLRR